MLLILFPYPFNDLFYKQYEVDLLKKKLKIKVEIHDLSKIANPLWRHAFKVKSSNKIKVFKNIKEWKNYFNILVENNKNIKVLNILDTSTFNSVILHYILFKSKVDILKYETPAFAMPINNIKIILSTKLIINFMHDLLFNFSKVIFFFKTKLFLNLIKLLKFERLFYLYSGKEKYYNFLRAKKKLFIKCHSKDYSNYLIHKNKKKLDHIKKPYALYLDIPVPHFVGDKKLFKYKINYDKHLWYKNLNKFLKSIEKKFNLKVIIIPHPKVRQTTNPFYDKHFKIGNDLDATVKLVPGANFVMAGAGTTATSYVVANNKRLILVTNDQIEKYNHRQAGDMKYLANILDCSLINLNENINKKNFLKKINKKNYLEYKYNHLTSKEITNKFNFEIFKKIIFTK